MSPEAGTEDVVADSEVPQRDTAPSPCLARRVTRKILHFGTFYHLSMLGHVNSQFRAFSLIVL